MGLYRRFYRQKRRSFAGAGDGAICGGATFSTSSSIAEHLTARQPLWAFGSEVRAALQQRSDFLIDQGLSERRGQRVVLARNLLATLRSRELAAAGQTIAAETGLQHQPLADGERVSGIYRRSVMLASGRFAMLDDGLGFRLVPWKPVIEQRLGQRLAATVRGSSVSWELGRQRGPSMT